MPSGTKRGVVRSSRFVQRPVFHVYVMLLQCPVHLHTPRDTTAFAHHSREVHPIADITVRPRKAVAELEEPRAPLQRRSRCAVTCIGCACIAAKLVLVGKARVELPCQGLLRPTRTDAQAAGIHVVKVVGLPRRQSLTAAALVCVEVFCIGVERAARRAAGIAAVGVDILPARNPRHGEGIA